MLDERAGSLTAFFHGPSYETVYMRWPIILTGVIDTIYRLDHELGLKVDNENADEVVSEKLKEGKHIIEQISRLKYEMSRDRPLEYVFDLFRSSRS